VLLDVGADPFEDADAAVVKESADGGVDAPEESHVIGWLVANKKAWVVEVGEELASLR
jgi:hypothetical protein